MRRTAFWGAASSAALLLIGGSNACLGSLPLPFALQTLGGGPGCLLEASNDFSAAVPIGPGGGAGMLLRLPGDPWLIGATIYHQWVIIDPYAPKNRLKLTTTGGLSATVGW